MIVHCAHDSLVDVASLKPHPKNRNAHSDEQIERLARILEYQGWRYPIKVSKRSGYITSGHGRLAAARANGWAEVPVNYQDYDSDEQEYADVQSDNAIASWAELDLSGINADVPELGPDFDIDMLGIRDFVLEPAELIPQADEDEVPEHVEPRTKLGDVYQLGRHRLMCGDATDAKCWDAIKSDGETLVFTSPPYGIGEGAKLREHYVRGAPKLKSLYNEHDDSPDAWIQLMRDWTALALSFSRAVVCNVQMLAKNKRDLITWTNEFATNMVDIVIWDKSHGPPQMQANVLTNAFEFLYILSPESGASRTIPLGQFHGNESNVVRVGKSHNNEFADVHKATMPVELVEWALRVVGAKASHVIDPFGGTGTTMIACEKFNKSCGLIEMDPKYCDVIVTRWEQYTGQKAELLNGELPPAPKPKAKKANGKTAKKARRTANRKAR